MNMIKIIVTFENHFNFAAIQNNLIWSWFVVALVPDKGGLKAWVSFLLLKHFLKLCTR